MVIFLILLFSDQTLGLFIPLLTTYDNRSKCLFSNSIQTDRCHYAADYMLLLQDRRREGNGLLKPFSPSVYVRLSDRFRLLLSAFFCMVGWDEFSGMKV